MNGLRNYKTETPQYKFYAEMHEKVDLEYTLKMRNKYSKYDKCKTFFGNKLKYPTLSNLPSS